MVRILFDDYERPKSREELVRIMGSIQIARRLEFKSAVIDDRETDDRFTGFMKFNPEPIEEKPKRISKEIKQFTDALNKTIYFY